LILGTEWPEYKNVDPQKVKVNNPNLVVLDAGRFLSSWAAHGITCISVGAPYSMGGLA